MGIWSVVTRVTNRVTNDVFSGDNVLFIPNGKVPFAIKAPYWRDYYETDLETGEQIRSTDPKVNILHVDLGDHTLSNKDRFKIDGETWGIERIEDDVAQRSSWVYLTKLALNI